MLFGWSRSAINEARLRVADGGIELDVGRPEVVFVPFGELVRLRVHGAELHVERVDSNSFQRETYVVRLDDAGAARKLADDLEGLRLLPASGPFRT